MRTSFLTIALITLLGCDARMADECSEGREFVDAPCDPLSADPCGEDTASCAIQDAPEAVFACEVSILLEDGSSCERHPECASGICLHLPEGELLFVPYAEDGAENACMMICDPAGDMEACGEGLACLEFSGSGVGMCISAGI